MSGVQAALRAACVDLLKSYAADAEMTLIVYPGRPLTMDRLPRAFVDAMNSRITYDGLRRQTPTASLIVVFGLFDSKEAADQRDAFVDGFLDWFTNDPHAAGANTVAGITAIEDLPGYTPDWTEKKATYYAVQITVEGYAE